MAIISFDVDESWAVSDLLGLLGSVEAAYGRLAKTIQVHTLLQPWPAKTSDRALTQMIVLSYEALVGKEVTRRSGRFQDVLPQEGPITIGRRDRLTIARISMASPGVISLEGSGEILRELGPLMDRLIELGHRRRMLKLEEISERLRVATAILEIEDRYGADRLERLVPGYRQLLDDAVTEHAVRLKDDLSGFEGLARRRRVTGVAVSQALPRGS